MPISPMSDELFVRHWFYGHILRKVDVIEVPDLNKSAMTREERNRPKIINGQRRKRIAAGSGRSVQEVNQLIKQWGEMNKMMGKMRSMMAGGKQGRRQMRNMMSQLKQSGGDLSKFL